MHKSNIINLLLKFYHSFDDTCKIENLLNDMVMLIDHNILIFNKLLHNKFDILCKTMSMLSLNNGILFLILILLMKPKFVHLIIFHSFGSDYTRFMLILLSNLRTITHNVYVYIF